MSPDVEVVAQQLDCPCGECEQISLSTCTCRVAESTRQFIHDRFSEGESPEKVLHQVKDRFFTNGTRYQ